MDYPAKCALITGFVSKTEDRFHEYNTEKTLGERLKLVSEMEGMTGVEVVYPYEINDAELLVRLLKQYQLDIAAINVNVKAEPEFRNGGLTSVDPGIRNVLIPFKKMNVTF